MGTTVYLPYALPAFGTLLQLGALNESPQTYTSIANIGDLSGPTLTVEDTDVTSHTQGFPWHVFVPCLINPGEITFPLFFIPYNIVADAGSGSPGGLVDIAASREMRDWRVQFPDAQESAWYFTGFISKYSLKAPVKGVLTMEVTLKLSGAVVFTGDALPNFHDVVSAALSVSSVFAQCAGYSAYATFMVGDALDIFAPAPWISDNGPGWELRTDTLALTGDALAELQGSTIKAQFTLDGSLFGDAVGTPAQLYIYESWIDVIFSNGSPMRLYPRTVTVIPGSTGDVMNASGANDGNPATAAVIERGHFSGAGTGWVLELSNYLP